MDEAPPVAVGAPRVLTRPLVVIPAFALISLVGGRFPSFSVGANVVVGVAGAVLFWLGLSARPPRRASVHLRSPLRASVHLRSPLRGSPLRPSGHAAWWLLPALLLAGVELLNLALGSTHDHPTLSGLADPLLEGYPARVAAYFGWLTAYWGLIRS
jgi:hypothetical protein